MSSLKVTNIKGLSTTITVPSSTTLNMSEADGLKLPTWTNNTRPGSPVTGMIGYNVEEQVLEFWNGTSWATGGAPQEQLWYNEGNDVRAYANNWNYTGTYNMTTLASFGNSYVHEWGGSPRTYELTLNNIPSHAEVRYKCRIHMIDSWDDEYNEIRMTNDSDTQLTYLTWRKIWNNDYLRNTTSNYGATMYFYGNQPYSYEPWNGNNQLTNGYVDIDTNWQPHTNSSIKVYHYTGLDQGSSDEAYYISHSQLYIR
jgi:hypothetical protein